MEIESSFSATRSDESAISKPCTYFTSSQKKFYGHTKAPTKISRAHYDNLLSQGLLDVGIYILNPYHKLLQSIESTNSRMNSGTYCIGDLSGPPWSLRGPTTERQMSILERLERKERKGSELEKKMSVGRDHPERHRLMPAIETEDQIIPSQKVYLKVFESNNTVKDHAPKRRLRTTAWGSSLCHNI